MGLLVKIIKCSKPTYWYRDQVGKTVEVSKETHKHGYKVETDEGLLTGIISFSDAEILNEKT